MLTIHNRDNQNLIYKMNNPKITAMYVIKNEERWIEKSLRSISEVCNEIVILDAPSGDKMRAN